MEYICASNLSWLSWLRTLWWRHQKEIFSALLALCAGNSPVTSEPVTGNSVYMVKDNFKLAHVKTWHIKNIFCKSYHKLMPFLALYVVYFIDAIFRRYLESFESSMPIFDEAKHETRRIIIRESVPNQHKFPELLNAAALTTRCFC